MDIEAFLRIEEKYGLNRLKYDGVSYWTYNRFYLWNYDICSQKLNLEEAHNKVKVSVKLLFNLAFYYLYSGKKPFQNDILVLNHNRRSFNGKTYDCIYTDCIVDNTYSAFFVEAPYQYTHFRPSTSKNVHYTDRLVINSLIYEKLYKIIHKKKYNQMLSDIQNNIKDALEELKKEYGWEGSAASISRKCAEKVLRCNYERKYYQKIIKKVNPKLIMEVVNYGRACMLINEIAKEMNIPSVELQHGTMYKEHSGYQYPKGESIKQLPDKLFVFSDFWKNCISFPIGDENIITTGFPNYERKRERYNDIVREDKRKTIIFISQGTIGKQLSLLAAELSVKLDSNEYRVIYKLHPAEYETWREDMPCLVDTSVEVIDNRGVDLYELFARSDIQIGAYSTAMFEGMGFGLRTFIYNVGHYDIMLPLIEQGYAELVTSAEECVKLINEDKSGNIDGSMFWKRNALENIRTEINAIINKSEG